MFAAQKYSTAQPVKRLVLPMAAVMLGLALLLLGMTIYSGRTMDRDAIQRQQALIDNGFTTRLNRPSESFVASPGGTTRSNTPPQTRSTKTGSIAKSAAICTSPTIMTG